MEDDEEQYKKNGILIPEHVLKNNIKDNMARENNK